MKRNHEIKIRFNDDEFNILNNKLEKTSLSREAFSRACILGKEGLSDWFIWCYKVL